MINSIPSQLGLAMLCCLLLVFFFSMIEIAWSSLGEEAIVAYEAEVGAWRCSREAKRLLKRRMVTVSMVLFCIHILTYFTPLLLEYIIRDKDGWFHAAIGVYAIVMFFVGEVVAKNIGYRFALQVVIASACPLRVLMLVVFPVTWLLRATNRLTGGKAIRLFDEKRLLAMLALAREQGAIHGVEETLFRRVITQGDKSVTAFMVPLAKCTTVSARSTWKELSSAMGFNYIIVYDGKDIAGVVTLNKVAPLMLGKTGEDIINLSPYLARPAIIPSSHNLTQALAKLMDPPQIGLVMQGTKFVGVISLLGILSQVTIDQPVE